MAALLKQDFTRERALALAEMSSDYADSLTEEQPLAAMGRYLDAAWLTRESSLLVMEEGGENPEKALNDYASARITRLLRDQEGTRKTSASIPGSMRTWELSLATGEGMVDPRRFDVVVPSSWTKTDGIKWKSITQDGAGVAMVGFVGFTPERKEADPQFPEAGRGYPLNARLEFDGNQANLILQDLMDDSDARIGGRTVPLEANFSSAVSFSYYSKTTQMSRIEALLRPGEFQDQVGLYSFRPHDPERIPLVLVHGLLSSAEAWLPFVNLLLADSVVRERYQLVLFNYPTGVPIARSMTQLREALEDYQKRNDPRRSNPNMRRMVILGHSMGGIISNAQIRKSGDHLYDSAFTKDIAELNLDPNQERILKRMAFFEANPDIDRAILLAAPLRGSAFASNRIGQLGARLIRLPFDFVDSVFGQIESIDALTDIAQQASQRPVNSVTSLRPDSPVLGGLLKCPVRPGVKIHSIMGQRDPSVPIEEGSDGLVPYSSAHLDEAVSEVVVMKADHRGMVEKDETLQEVWRILYEHVGRRRMEGSGSVE
ncbi:MAG: alpha/beta hydrolase [Verrucomicrobiota bacterium]